MGKGDRGGPRKPAWVLGDAGLSCEGPGTHEAMMTHTSTSQHEFHSSRQPQFYVSAYHGAGPPLRYPPPSSALLPLPLTHQCQVLGDERHGRRQPRQLALGGAALMTSQ